MLRARQLQHRGRDVDQTATSFVSLRHRETWQSESQSSSGFPERVSGFTPSTVSKRDDASAAIHARHSRSPSGPATPPASARGRSRCGSRRGARQERRCPGSRAPRAARESRNTDPRYRAPGSTMPCGSRPLTLMRTQPSRSVGSANARVRDQSNPAACDRSDNRFRTCSGRLAEIRCLTPAGTSCDTRPSSDGCGGGPAAGDAPFEVYPSRSRTCGSRCHPQRLSRTPSPLTTSTLAFDGRRAINLPSASSTPAYTDNSASNDRSSPESTLDVPDGQR